MTLKPLRIARETADYPIRIYIFSFLLMVGISKVPAQEVYEVDTNYPVHSLSDKLRILEDTQGKLSWEEVMYIKNETFLPRSNFGQFLDEKSVYWGKIKLKALDSVSGWTLNLEDPWLNNIDWIRSNGKVDVFYLDNSGLIAQHKTGVDYPKALRSIPDRWVRNRVPLDLQKNKEIQVLIRVKGNSFGFPPYFNLSLRDPAHQYYHPWKPSNKVFLWFVFGVAFIMFVYHLLLWLYLKDRIYFWFSLWLLICTLTQAMTVGLDAEYLLGDMPGMRLLIFLIVPQSIIFVFWFFGRSFIRSREKFPKVDKAILFLTSLMILELLFTLGYTYISNNNVYWTGVGYHYYFIILFSVLGFFLAIAITSLKDSFARYFGIGAMLATSFFILGGLWSAQILYPGFDPFTTGIFIQVVAYSFGIALRQQKLQKDSYEKHLAFEKSTAEVQRIRDMDQIKTRFFANISHEFRTPLSLIKGPLEQLSPNPETGEKLQMDSKTYQILKRNTHRLEKLVDQLLDLSKLESGNEILRLQKGGLVPFLRATTFSFESVADRKNISLQASFPDNGDERWYDKDKLEKILSNLLSNAFKYTPQGGTISIGATCDQEFLSLEIKDSGKGIDKSDVPRIFERFYRVEGTEEKGSGIGLALVKELVDLYRGQIHIDSTRGIGTAFRLRLPIGLDYIKKHAIPHSFVDDMEIQSQVDFEERESTPEKYNRTSRKGPVVLIAEDNDDLRAYMVDILDDQYRVLLASNGLQGERMAIEHIPDLVISDVMMPEKDGFAMCNSLKRNPKTSHIPVILLTAKAGQDHIKEGLTHGADAYITKPFDVTELLLRVRNLIDSREKIWQQFQKQNHLLLEEMELVSLDDQFLQQVLQFIKNNIDNDTLSVEDIAAEVGFSRSQLHRKLKALTNKSASQIITELRLNEARLLLEKRTGTVSEIAYAVGYSNLSYFTKSFKEKFGTLPSQIG